MNSYMGLPLGKKPVRVDKRTVQLTAILKVLPPLPESYSIDSSLDEVIPTPMYANDKYGCCVISSRAHQTLRFEAVEQDCAISITDDEVLEEYWRQGRSKCKLLSYLNPKPDNGLVLIDSLNAWRKEGWKVSNLDYTIYAYAGFNPRDHYDACASIYLLGGVSAGIRVTQSAIEQFKRDEAWDITTDTRVVGGHAIYIESYDKDGLTCLTWGKKQRMTWQFWDNYCDESYAIVDNRNVWMPNSPIDVEKLNEILCEITR